MATNEHITEWSTTAACTPAGSDSIGSTLDDEIRQLKAWVYKAERRDAAAKSAAYTSTISDFGSLIPVTPSSGTLTVSLAAASTVGLGWRVIIQHNGTAQGVLIDGDGTDTVGGSITYSLVNPGECVEVVSNGTDGWYITGNFLPRSAFEGVYEPAFASTTRMLFQQTSAPTGYTKETGATYNDVALRVVTGTASSSTGNDAFTTVFGTGKTTGAHNLTEAELPTITVRSLTNTPVVVADTFTTTVAKNTTRSIGSGDAHSHTISNLNLDYYDVIIAEKD